MSDPSADWWADERRRRQAERARDAEDTPAADHPSADDRSADDRSADDRSADDRSAEDRSADDPAADHPRTPAGGSLIETGIPGPRRRLSAVGVAILLVCALVAAGVAAVATGAVRLGGFGTGVAQSPGAGRSSSSSSPTARPTPTRPAARAVLPPPSEVLPTASGLAAALKSALGVPELAKQPTSVAIRDVTSGRLLYGKDQSTGFIPASTTKLLTSTAALGLLGPDHRFTTKVVRGAKAGQIVLVGGGDPSLATAAARSRIVDPAHSFRDAPTVDGLAAGTAKALRAAGTTSVGVLVDDSLFSEQVNPEWEEQYVPTGVVARVSALWVDENKLSWPSQLPRAKDPAVAAGDAFVAALRKNGITVTGEPAHGRAPAKAATIASVQSPPLADLIEHVLLVSDNDGAEILARQVAVASGKPATSAGAAAAVKAELARLGVAGADKISLYDGSGLSRHNRISADVLSKVLVVASRSQNPKLRPLLTSLPIAGFTGSLARRFGGSDGVGLVRAKTGTLSGVSSLAGLATTRDGATLAFAVMSDKATKYDPHGAIDNLAAKLATCGCR
ncbi:D-alanyl-D-alanine carboxypeptidase/D-alanyl-D-alanine endopeptidase [Actinopolymorpha rutila]|uniref:D-alanyl-D-alanine carboxypeptidase/D-alanyl-D-alanine-endopeptidase (Penicillin-binding protein 4) n=1 Tax=Actinopolymorpha rutila TaxID=446787 RepID=A0A852ZM72_9ACTN|nr:D-alanyl-D-alanine carboxypeptidase/D-alanyl-D-alanine-endopeptidase (penicillin-binding protein 4) [Actinopolymorpha rutila]